MVLFCSTNDIIITGRFLNHLPVFFTSRFQSIKIFNKLNIEVRCNIRYNNLVYANRAYIGGEDSEEFSDNEISF